MNAKVNTSIEVFTIRMPKKDENPANANRAVNRIHCRRAEADEHCIFETALHTAVDDGEIHWADGHGKHKTNDKACQSGKENGRKFRHGF